MSLYFHRNVATPELPPACHHANRLSPKKTGNQISFQQGVTSSTSPLRVGVVLSGGQAAGGHNVIAGLYDALVHLHPKSQLFGFLEGPRGILEGNWRKLTEEVIGPYRNQGGFDLLGSGRDKIEKEEQFAKASHFVTELRLDGLVIIGGDDSNTNADALAHYFLSHGVQTSVVGVPKTIDGDLKGNGVEASFGFDSATKVYSSMIGNLARDALSAKKYYFFVKLMGRSASHIALECALQTHPNLTLIGEEVAEKGESFQDIVKHIADLIVERASLGKQYGVILIPEGLIEFIPEFRSMIQEMNRKEEGLSQESQKCLNSLPPAIQQQLLLDRDPHGNVQVSKIETERLLIEGVKRELKQRSFGKLHAQPLFFGYEGRCCYPSHFDTNYCSSLGFAAALLVRFQASGYMAIVRNLAKPVSEWELGGVAIDSMICEEMRSGKLKKVIRKALVDLKGAPFKEFAKHRKAWRLEDEYCYPGPIQYFGPEEIIHRTTQTLQLESARQ